MDDSTLLHRQVHPSWVQNNVVSSQVFIQAKDISSLTFAPSAKDGNKLSVYNGKSFQRKNPTIITLNSLNPTVYYPLAKWSANPLCR